MRRYFCERDHGRGLLVACVALLVMSVPAVAGEFHVDPQHGSAEGDGSAARPWKNLQAVLDAGRVESRKWASLPYRPDAKLLARNAGAPIKPGDTILLHTGEYGELVIDGYYNARPITIAAAEGQTPRFHRVVVRSSSNWILRGLLVSPQFAPGEKPRSLVALASHGWRGPIHDVTVAHCTIRSAENTAGWSKKDWNTRACNGMSVSGTRMTLRNNHVKNVNFGISVGATHSLIEGNIVENFAGDGLRGLGDHTTFQSNTVKNCYDVNDNHDDGFQSWTVGPKGVGTGRVVGVVLRGNTIIDYEDDDQPHRGALQGIGCFDGMFEDWVIENNVVIVNHYHGITLLGARNCRIVNNTVIDRDHRRPGPPWVCIGKHKNGEPSTACVVRNNLTTDLRIDDGQQVTADHNVMVEHPEAVFVSPQTFDLRVKPGGEPIDAGTGDLAPETDITGTRRPQGEAVDVGAHEHAVEGLRPESPDGAR